MIEVWGRRNSNNVMAVMWAVAELGLEHHRHDAGGSFGGLDTEDFLAMNPNGRIPVICHEGQFLYESTAIVRYLAAVFDEGTLSPVNQYQNAVADQWMDWVKSTFYPAFHPLFWGLIRTPEDQRHDNLIKQAAASTAKVLRVAEQRLSKSPYLGGDQFTMGDIPLGSCIYRYFHLEIDRPRLPALESWYNRLVLRPAYQQHIMIPFGRNYCEWMELETRGNTLENAPR